MSLDVYVAPLWRYRSGNLASPLEEWAREAGVSYRRILIAPLSFSRKVLAFRPRSYVRWLQRKLSTDTGVDVRWDDRGPTVYSEQGRFQPLRAFAKWLDCRERVTEFTSPPEEGDWFSHPIHEIEVAELTYPTLVGFGYQCGYLLPVEFDGIREGERLEHVFWTESYREVASSQRVLRELSELRRELPSEEGRTKELWWVGYAVDQLSEVVTLSLEHSLPVIFDGWE